MINVHASVQLDQISDTVDLVHQLDSAKQPLLREAVFFRRVCLSLHLYKEHILPFNPIALRKTKIVCNFGLSECNRVKRGPKQT